MWYSFVIKYVKHFSFYFPFGHFKDLVLYFCMKVSEYHPFLRDHCFHLPLFKRQFYFWLQFVFYSLFFFFCLLLLYKHRVFYSFFFDMGLMYCARNYINFLWCVIFSSIIGTYREVYYIIGLPAVYL